MSDGKSFAPKKIISNEERLEDLERKYGVVLDRIQSYDKILIDFESLKKRYNSLSSNLNENITQSQGSQKELKELLSSLSLSSGYHQHRIGGLEEQEKSLKTQLENIFQYAVGRSDSLSKDIERHSGNFKRLLEEKLNQSQFESYQKLQKDMQINNERNIQSVRDFIVSVQASISDVSENFAKKLEMLSEHGKAIQTFLVWINSFEEKVAKQIQQYQVSFLDKIRDDHNSILERLQEMKKELLGTPTSNASVEKRIMNRLEANTIESANAVRMMGTNQDRLKLLEKKVEALTTQLTKYEIK